MVQFCCVTYHKRFINRLPVFPRRVLSFDCRVLTFSRKYKKCDLTRLNIKYPSKDGPELKKKSNSIFMWAAYNMLTVRVRGDIISSSL